MIRLDGSRRLETTAHAERRARALLPPTVYKSLVAGADQGASITDNLHAFRQLRWVPRVGHVPWPPDLKAHVLGMDLGLPVLLAPVGAHALHPAAEIAAASAADAFGVPTVLSAFASRPFEEIAKVNRRAVAQLYWVGDRSVMVELVKRAAAAGARALAITMDVIPGPSPRDWGTPRLPERLTITERLRQVPTALAHPRWTVRQLLGDGVPGLLLPNLRVGSDPPPTFLEGRNLLDAAGPPRWDDIAWLRSQWNGPLVVKGVMHPRDARRALEAGATAIVVSNHGGNNLDGTPSPLRVLPAIRAAVEDEAEVLYDGGVRRGSDIAKVLAMGADAVLIGRAWAFGLAARGQAGVEDVLQYLRDGLARAVAGLGHKSARDLTARDLVIPADFAMALDTR